MLQLGNLGRMLLLAATVLAAGGLAWIAASPALSRSEPDRPARVAGERPDLERDSQAEGPEDPVAESEDGGEDRSTAPARASSTVPATDDYANGDD